MSRIAVINNGISILPFSLKAVATIYEYDPSGEDDKSGKSLTNTGKWYRVDKLIENQHAFYSDDYPADLTDECNEDQLIHEIICGSIDRSFEYALNRLGIQVTKNVYGEMKDFTKRYLEDSFWKHDNALEQFRGAEKFLDFIKIAGPDPESLEFGYVWYYYDLTDREKLYLLDIWISDSSNWDLFDQFIVLFRVNIPFYNAVKYAWHFIRHGTQPSHIRLKDIYLFQELDLKHFQLLKNHVDPECEREFLGEAMVLSVKYRLILFVEYLMDCGVDIDYLNGRCFAVADLERRLLDQTLLNYLEYYRKNGKKPEEPAASYFIYMEGEHVYTPECKKDSGNS